MVAYLAGWATYSNFNILTDVDGSRLTHINYAFANINGSYRVVMEDPAIDGQNFNNLLQLKVKYPHLKTLISIGGWNGSANFSKAAATDKSRTTFANSAVDFMVQNGFDGIDLDWEYPVTGGGPGTRPNPKDRTNYPLLLQKVRETLNKREKIDGKKYLLTIAGGATAGFASNTQLGFSHQYLDYVQIMTYDIHGTWESRSDFNAPLFDAGGETYSVNQGVQAYINAGVPANKIVMGVPFYGYKYMVTSTANNGLRQPFDSSGSGSITYKTIKTQDLENSGYTRYWHDGSKVPWLFNGTSTFISYDDQESITYKAQYIRDYKLGGAMIWELSQDYQIDLLNTLYTILKDPVQ